MDTYCKTKQYKPNTQQINFVAAHSSHNISNYLNIVHTIHGTNTQYFHRETKKKIYMKHNNVYCRYDTKTQMV